MMIKTEGCLYLLTPDLTFEIILVLDYKFCNIVNQLNNNVDPTLISLIILTILIVSSLFWLVFRTLKEGRKALTEMNKDKF